MKMTISFIGSLTTALAISGVLAAPTADNPKPNSMIACEAVEGVKAPFPYTVCKPFTLTNGTTIAAFVKNPAMVQKFTIISSLSGKKMNTTNALDETNLTDTTWTPNTQHLNYCDISQAITSGHVTPQAPLVADCLAIKEWAAANAGHWVVSKADMDGHTWTALSVVGSCAFVVGATAENRPDWGIAIGSRDVEETIQQAVEKHQIGGHVEVAGRTPCTSWKEGWVRVAADWYVVNPAMVDWDN